MRYLIHLALLLSILTLTGCGEESSDTPKTTNPLFNSFGIGVGGSSSFKFASIDGEDPVYIGLDKLINGISPSNSDYYANKVKKYDASAFTQLQTYLDKSKFFTIWVTKGWKKSWYSIDSINSLIEAGKIPVFIYWYFGDNLVTSMPTQDEIKAYKEDVQRFSNMLTQINTTSLVILEPEFNKHAVLENPDAFISIMTYSIDTIKKENNNALLSLCMTDAGSRATYSTYEGCGYENCSLGDKKSWDKTAPIYNALLDKIDFISFQEMLGQFSRNPANPGTFDTPIPYAYTNEALGISSLHTRIENFSKYLYEKYNKPVYLPYISIATATWDDANNDNQIQNNEIAEDGWETEANFVYNNIDKTKLLQNHMFGFSIISLFDQPDHDVNGYQYFMNNEYHLGIVKSSAEDGTRDGIYGDIVFKKDILDSLFK